LCVGFESKGQIIKLQALSIHNTEKKALDICNGCISDINGTIKIKFEKKNLENEIFNFSNSNKQIDLNELNEIKHIINLQNEILKLTNKSQKEDPEGLVSRVLREKLLEHYDYIIESEKLTDLYNNYSNNYDEEFPVGESNESPPRLEYIFDQFSKLIIKYSDEIKKSLNESKVTFSLAGFKKTKTGLQEIKVSDDFDDYEGDQYNVNRWQFGITQETRAQVNEISNLANNLNNSVDEYSGNLKAGLKNIITNQGCLTRLISLENSVQNETPEGFGQEFKQKITDSFDNMKRVNDDIGFFSSTAQYNEINVNYNNAERTIMRLNAVFNTLDSTTVNRLGDLKKPSLNVFVDDYRNCKQKLINVREILAQIIFIVRNIKKASESTIELGEKVKRLPPDMIPDSSFFDLTETGERHDGDKIILRAVLEKEVENGNKIRKTLEERFFLVYQVGLHSIVKPSLIFADPLGAGMNIAPMKSRFRFAPSYSVLFKWGSRKSTIYNELLNLGIGVNFASPDFDTDGVPEFAVSLEATLLKDFFSIGRGYNLGVDAPLWFFGFRLPLNNIGIPIFNSITNDN
jgi:hypothetical protein